MHVEEAAKEMKEEGVQLYWEVAPWPADTANLAGAPGAVHVAVGCLCWEASEGSCLRDTTEWFGLEGPWDHF